MLQCNGTCNSGATWDNILKIMDSNSKLSWINNDGCLGGFNVVQNVIHGGYPVIAGITWPNKAGHVIIIVGYISYWRGTAGNGAADFYYDFLISDSLNPGITQVSEDQVCSNYAGKGGVWTNSLYILPSNIATSAKTSSSIFSPFNHKILN